MLKGSPRDMASSTGLRRCEGLYPPSYPQLAPSHSPRTSQEIGLVLASAISPTDSQEAQLLWQAPIRGKGKNKAQGQASAGRTCALGSRLVLASQPCTSSVYTQRPSCLPTRPGHSHYPSFLLDGGCGFSTGIWCQKCPPPTLSNGRSADTAGQRERDCGH